LIFPVHPRTAARMKEFGLTTKMKMVEPLGYLDSLCLMAGATLVLTDSGGIQEETTVLGVPCLTIRDNTERPVTVTEGTNTLVKPATILAEAKKILSGNGKRGRAPKYWDGRAAERIVQCLLDHPPKR
jgi:UDP-N-acetylglucosamine 2-epimerase (non-hydrolysing)